MTPPSPSVDAIIRASARVDESFAGFIGNAEAVYAIKRALTVAIARTPDGQTPALPKTFLLWGPPSVGKTEMARRIARALGDDMPFVHLDGRAVKSRERLFEAIDDELQARQSPAKRDGMRSGVPILIYPPLLVFVDEVHLIGGRTQEALLTLLEADDRSLQLDGKYGRRVAMVKGAAWVFATTRQNELDKAFRSRCAEVPLRRYAVEEVAQMVVARFPDLPAEQVRDIAACSRQVPRQAFALAQEVEEEITLSGGLAQADIRACVRRVMHGRDIRYANGITRTDVRYLNVLKREGRPVGESSIIAALYDVDPANIREDIEPFLMLKGYVAITSRGRELLTPGHEFLDRAREAERAYEDEQRGQLALIGKERARTEDAGPTPALATLA